MFKWPFTKKESKPLIVCIHGFGRRKSIEFTPLINKLPEYQFITPELYDQTNKDDDQYLEWIGRAEKALLEATHQNRRVILVGFSMGGVIASHLASKFKVEKLILIAPAFEYLTLKTATQAITSVLGKAKPTENLDDLPRNFASTFMSVVDHYKDDIYRVDCPLLILHASDDEVIPCSVNEKLFPKLTNQNKKCLILQGGRHCLLDDPALAPLALYLIESFIENKF